MLETYFSAAKTLKRLRTGPSAPYIDGFAIWLTETGYSASSAVRYLRAASHLGHFLDANDMTFSDVDSGIAEVFRQHLTSCRCPSSNGGRINHHNFFGVKRFHHFLQQLDVCSSDSIHKVVPDEHVLILEFRHWLDQHRGAVESTLKLYSRYANELIVSLGEETHLWEPHKVREFFLSHVGLCGASTMEKKVTSARAFLRFLIAHDRCRADLDQAVPTLAHWRLATLPRSLTPTQVTQLLDACQGDTPRRVRDRAIVLLLLLLGLRAGDVSAMRISDLEWDNATVRVSGKARNEVRLPLPQVVGDAIIHYLGCRQCVMDNNHLFISNIAPFSAISRDGVSSVVKRALSRAGIQAPVKGAHLLRHTAACQMLRQGMPLEQIGTVLRHRNVYTTAYYAKVDTSLLSRVTQPWPEVIS
jgi:site-specific recombinase XerD